MKKALIVAPSWIGDTIMAQPLFARLHAKHPGLQLDALAPRWVAPVLHRMDEISDVVDSPFGHGQLSLKPRWRLARNLAARDYDAAYVLPNSLKSALVPFLAGIPLRVGFTGESRYGLINLRHRLDKAALPLMVERFAQLAEAPDAPLPRPISYPKIRSTADAQQQTLSELGLERPARIVAFCPGAEYGPAKRWPAAHFAVLAELLAEQGCAIWLFGSPKDHAVAEEIAQLGARPLPQPVRRDHARPGRRPVGPGRPGGLQRLRADARCGRSRPATGHAVRLVVARLHAAALRPGRHSQPATGVQPVLQARMSAWPPRLPE